MPLNLRKVIEMLRLGCMMSANKPLILCTISRLVRYTYPTFNVAILQSDSVHRASYFSQQIAAKQYGHEHYLEFVNDLYQFIYLIQLCRKHMPVCMH